jgi:CBS domain-containing protein
VARTQIDAAAELTAAEVVHKRFTALPATATVGDVRDWFAASGHRRMAFLTGDDGRYIGSVVPADVSGDGDRSRLASEVAQSGPTIAPERPAVDGYRLALATDARRVPVVDADGRLVGVVSVTEDLSAFCGTS